MFAEKNSIEVDCASLLLEQSSKFSVTVEDICELNFADDVLKACKATGFWFIKVDSEEDMRSAIDFVRYFNGKSDNQHTFEVRTYFAKYFQYYQELFIETLMQSPIFNYQSNVSVVADNEYGF